MPPARIRPGSQPEDLIRRGAPRPCLAVWQSGSVTRTQTQGLTGLDRVLALRNGRPGPPG